MLTPRQKYEVCRVKSGTALFPVIDTKLGNIFSGISTRNGNSVITWGDGTVENYTNPRNVDFTVSSRSNIGHTYATAYSGDIAIKFMQGFRDVYSLNLTVYHQTGVHEIKFNIQNFGTFINQFSNLYSLYLELYAYQQLARMSVIKGNLADIPNSLKRFKIYRLEIPNGATDYWFNLSTLQGKSLEYLDLDFGAYSAKIIGDIGKLPVSSNFIKILSARSDSAITYTAGKVWASSFDTLSILLPLTTSELDNLLIDMDNSITTKIGAGVITLSGLRSVSSDAAVASLVAKGFTVNVNRVLNNVSNADSAILRLDFQNNFDVYSNSGMNIIAGGSSNQPTFALSGRKAGEYCAVFNGSQSIKTTTNLPINSDKVTIAFWMKTTQTTLGLFVELSENWSTAGTNAFAVFANGGTVNKLYTGEQTTNTVRNVRQSTADINDNTWKHIAVVIDRANPTATKITIYINGVSAGTTATTNGSTTGNFVNNILFIGQRAGSTAGFNGSVTRLKIYNYPFTPAEVTNLYNSEL